MGITLREGLGRALTFEEMDDNFIFTDIRSVARSLNVSETEVIFATDTTTVLDNVLYIYDETAQVIWGVPELDSTGKTIVSVVGDVLTTTGGTGGNTYTLRYIQTDASSFQKIEDKSGWEDSTDLADFKDKYTVAVTPNEYNISGKTLKVWKSPSGIKDSAVAASFSLGDGSEDTTQVSGYNTVAEMADYANRDSVAVFAQNTSKPATLTTTNTTYTSTSVTSADIGSASGLETGMTVEIFTPTHYVSRVDTISGNTITVEAWYLVGGGGSTGTPANGSELDINRFTKVWAHNANVNIPSDGGANSATTMELGIILNKNGTGPDSVVYDAVNLGGAYTPGAGYRAKGGFTNGYEAKTGCTSGFYSDTNTYGFRAVDSVTAGFRSESGDSVGFQSESDVTGFEAINSTGDMFKANVGGTSKFNVDSTGRIDGSFFAFQVVTTTTTLALSSVISVVTTPGVTITLPSAVGSAGKVLIVKNASGGNITVNGVTVATGIGKIYGSDNVSWITLLTGA